MKRIQQILPIAIAALLTNASLRAAPDKYLVPTPPMGWNSWNCVGRDVTEELVCGIADAMVESGMKDAGYTYIVIDDVWHKGRVDFTSFDAKGNQSPAGEDVPGRDFNFAAEDGRGGKDDVWITVGVSGLKLERD